MRSVRPCFVRNGVGVVPLSQGYEALVDVDDLPVLALFNWSVTRSLKKGGEYAQRAERRDGKLHLIKMHRVITNAPKGLVVDHINGDGLDNRRVNLRLCVQSDNMKNQAVHVTNKLGIKGVSKKNNRYVAKISHGDRAIWLGSYLTAEEAASAYRGAAKALFGDFAAAA